MGNPASMRKGDNARSGVLDVKGSMFTLSVLQPKNTDMVAFEAALEERIAQAPRFFQNAPVVIDVQALRDMVPELDFAGLVALLRRHQLVPVGVRHATPAQQTAAVAAGLALLHGGSLAEATPAAGQAAASQVTHAVETPPTKAAPTVTSEPQVPPAPSVTATPTKTLTTPVRSGQRIYARGGDLVILAAVNAGAEVLADGNIHIYGPLRGRALAGVLGDAQARIYAQSMEAELVSVAGHYRVFEPQPPDELRGKPTQIYLERERLVIAPL